MIVYREINLSEMKRISEIDRTENIAKEYVNKDDKLSLVEVNSKVGPWDYEEKLNAWAMYFKDDFKLWGAFDDNKLIGVSGYKSYIKNEMGLFTLLHISNKYRRQGIGIQLANLVILHAKGQENKKIYVSSAPTQGTVDFYSSLGFNRTDTPIPELFEMEPKDIHMILDL